MDLHGSTGERRRGGDDVAGGRDPLIGQTLAHYRIVARLGGGGMGVVYRGEDTRLRRSVALKFVSDDLSRDPEALRRFAREAQTASALNHTNICTIHDIGEQDGRSFIVMEYLQGTTLKDRLAAGTMSLPTALDVGIQIADALEAAHSAGIVHRDIKPANVFVGPRERVKVLDFGLAKSGPATPQADVTTMTGTRHGVVMGTAAYMAPEQARGEAVDHRADIWSFGLVLYEMVKGMRPAQAVRLRVEASPELERIVSKCLETERELRYQHAADLRTDLERLRRGHGAAVAQPARGRGARWLAIGAAAVVVIAAVAGAIYSRRPAPLTDKDTIVLADFANTTGDAVFDETLRQGLAVQLQQSPFLSLISNDRVSRTLALMQQRPDARLTPALAQDVCVRTGSAVVVEGSIANLGSQYVVGLRARNCGTGDVIADEQAQAARKEDVLGALSQIAIRFRTRVGESIATIEKHSKPLQEATTPSMEALQAYSTGVRLSLTTNRQASVALFERAVAIDPNFAIAHARLGMRYSALGESSSSRQSILKAYQLRDRVSDAERFFIEMVYDRDFTGNLEREQRTLESWAQTYPRDPIPHGLQGGYVTRSIGKYALAIEHARKALAIDPDLAPTHDTKAFAELHLNRLEDAEATIRQGLERRLDTDAFVLVPYFIAFLRGDAEAMSRTAAAARSRRSTEDMIAHLEALVLARAGRLHEARRSSSTAVEIARRAGQQERTALFEVAPAVWEAFYGNTTAARQKATQALTLSRSRHLDYAAAFALALSGGVARARQLTADLEKNYPEDTSVQSLYLPALRARFAIDARDPSAAIQSLQSASRYDLGRGGLAFYMHFGSLYPIYVRGQAYLAARQPSQAAAEFQRIVDQRSIVLVDPIDAMARLQLARALALSGDTEKAKKVYDDLFALWENADAGIPLITEARAEYARLR
jgi:serine/threonine protein kinase/tetratricopeptide (TPR) repeat protein